MAYYRDPTHFDNVPVETLPVWPEFDVIRREVDQLLPLIRQPHWTSWHAASASGGLHIGTRDYGGERYLLLVNPSNSSVNSTITVNDLPYVADGVYDYFTETRMTDVVNGAFTINLPAYGTAVYRLGRTSGAKCQPDLNRDGTTNAADVSLMVSEMLSESGEICTDLNGDGEINVLDLQTLVNIVQAVP